jgi:hypothetical protein
MPSTADKTAFATHRALAVALERLAPVRRRQIVKAAADRLANGGRVPPHWIALLDTDEVAQAYRLAARHREKREISQMMTTIATMLCRLRGMGHRLVAIAQRVHWRRP